MNYRKLDPEIIQVASAYQRNLRTAMMREIISNYEEEAFGVLVVGERKDGSVWCVDGQTRLNAAIKLGLAKVPALVFESTGKAHEAKMFRLLNTQTQQSKLQKLKSLIVEGDAESLALKKCVESAGFALGLDGQKSWPHIRTILPLELAHKLGCLYRVLSVIESAWGGEVQDCQALQLPMIGGLALFIKQHGDVVGDEQLAKKLMGYTVAQLVALCDARRMQGGSRQHAMLDVLVQVWNKDKKNKLQVSTAA